MNSSDTTRTTNCKLVTILDGGGGYSSNSTPLRSDMPKQANTVEANFTAVIGTAWGRLVNRRFFQSPGRYQPEQRRPLRYRCPSYESIRSGPQRYRQREFDPRAPRSIRFSYSSHRCGFLYAERNLITDNGYLHFSKKTDLLSAARIFPAKIAVGRRNHSFLRIPERSTGTSITSTPFPTTPTGIIASPHTARNRIHELNGPNLETSFSHKELTPT